jgi:selenocysteine lyase/cysteine desulfurase
MGVDILTASGHKGILGPLGTGLLYVAEEIADHIHPLRYGGTGTDGSIEIQPTTIPDKFESGNLNVPGIAGLYAGIKFLNSEEGSAAHHRQEELSQLFLDGILGIDRVQLQGSRSAENRIGVFSFLIDGLGCHEASSILDSNWSVQTRAGLHCAPLVHRALGTAAANGTVRVSLGPFNTRQHIETAVEAISRLASI